MGMVLYALIGITLGIQVFLVVQHQTERPCKNDANYELFNAAAQRLRAHESLYVDRYFGHCYGYKYSPTFAAVWALMVPLPKLLGLILWSMLGMLLVHAAILTFPGMSAMQRLGFFLLILMELVASMSTQQTNALIGAFLMLAYMNLERGRPIWASLLIVATVYIKVFGIFAMLLYLFYPDKPKLMLYTVLWTVILWIVPLYAVSPQELWAIYGQWQERIVADYGLYAGMSVYAFLEAMLGFAMPKQVMLIVSFIALLVTTLQFPKWQQLQFRQLSLAAILLWSVAFNHKAESPSYVIAMLGVGIWFFASPPRWWRVALLIFAFLVMSLLYSDLIGSDLRNAYGYTWALKALPTTVAWLAALLEMWWLPRGASPLPAAQIWSGIRLHAPVQPFTWRKLR